MFEAVDQSVPVRSGLSDKEKNLLDLAQKVVKMSDGVRVPHHHTSSIDLIC